MSGMPSPSHQSRQPSTYGQGHELVPGRTVNGWTVVDPPSSKPSQMTAAALPSLQPPQRARHADIPLTFRSIAQASLSHLASRSPGSEAHGCSHAMRPGTTEHGCSISGSPRSRQSPTASTTQFSHHPPGNTGKGDTSPPPTLPSIGGALSNLDETGWSLPPRNWKDI